MCARDRFPHLSHRQCRYVKYFMSRIEMLLSHNVTPIVVFDGCQLPMKGDENESRRR